MSVWRRILLFPLTRFAIWAAIMIVAAFVLGLGASALHLAWPASNGVAALASLLAYIFLVKVVERRSLEQGGLGSCRMLRDTAVGFGIGALYMSAVIGTLALAGWYRIDGLAVTGEAAFVHLGRELLLFLFVAVSEEVALRGVFYRVLEESLGTWISLGLSALLFGLLHLGNPNATLVATLAIALEAGIMLAAAYMLTKNLWMAIGIHWSWNWMQGSVYGAAVSGGQGRGLFNSTITGPEVLTGGAFGPEAGLVALTLGVALGVWLTVLAVRKGHLVRPFWRRSRAAAAAAD